MASKLRPLYDKIYIGTECWLNARGARRDAKRYAAGLGPCPQVEAEYARVIRPYWKQFRLAVPKKYWFTLFANCHKPFSAQYIPDGLWFGRIIPHYNNLIFAKALQDKCLASLLFPDVRRPETLVKCVAGVFYDDGLRLLTREQAVARCRGGGRAVVKPSVGSGKGQGIRFFDADGLSDSQVDALFSQYGDNFIVQKKMTQHPALARFNPASLNTVRIITFLRGGKVHALAPILRVGGSGSEVDNVSQGGFQFNLGPDGAVLLPAFTHAGGRWEYAESYPNGIGPDQAVVPSYDRIVRLVTDQAARLSHFRIIGWDVAVAPDGEPVLVEFNVIPGQNQESGGPTFGPLTDQVLTEVFGRRNAP